VALAAGGALEIVDDGSTGFLFDSQDADVLAEAMRRARGTKLSTADLVASARRFEVATFYERFDAALATARAAKTAPVGEAMTVEAAL
jgi:glycosyltransferase involved in cell wall biosynthesis